jgi:hypothetical protein
MEPVHFLLWGVGVCAWIYAFILGWMLIEGAIEWLCRGDTNKG